MAYSHPSHKRTVHCRYCHQSGHNRSSCPTLAGDIETLRIKHGDSHPWVELYDLKKDPDQLVNVADNPAYAKALKDLKKRLFAQLKETGDPRITGKGPDFDKFPYLGGVPKYPGYKKPKKAPRK